MFSTLIAVVCVLLCGTSLASPNGALYECDVTKLANENLCYFVASSTNTAGASPHNIDRTVGADHYRIVKSSTNAALSVSPKPWTQGDVLASSSAEVDGELWNYVLAFEMIAPLRDAMMYNPTSVTKDAARWKALTKPMVDCNVKASNTVDGTNTVYGVDGIYGFMSDIKANAPSPGPSAHHSILRFLEEGAIDLVCAMTTLSMDRCTDVRSHLNINEGSISTCWVPGYNALYNSSVVANTTVVPLGSSSAAGHPALSSAVLFFVLAMAVVLVAHTL